MPPEARWASSRRRERVAKPIAGPSGQLRREHVGMQDLGRGCEEVVGFAQEGAGNRSVRMRVASLLVGEGVDDRERRGIRLEGEPGDCGCFVDGERSCRLEERGELCFPGWFRLEADDQSLGDQVPRVSDIAEPDLSGRSPSAVLASVVDEREDVDVVFVLKRVQGHLGREVAARARSACESDRRAVAVA